MPNIERTGWRDQAISTRHRLWGDHLFACDIDWLLLEYYSKRPVLLIDYKHILARETLDLQTASIKALEWLATTAGIQFWIVIYDLDADEPTFEMIPMNQKAKQYLGGTLKVSEDVFVRHLYNLRGLAQGDYLERILENLKETV